jgi:hypothetical protein
MALTAAKVAERESMELRRILSATSLTPFADTELDELTGRALETVGQSPRLEELVRSLLDLDGGLPAFDLIRARSVPGPTVSHVHRITYHWATVRSLDRERAVSQNSRCLRRLRRDFGDGAPWVISAVASAQENFASQLRHPSGGFYEPQLVESLRRLGAVLGLASHQALLARLSRRERRQACRLTGSTPGLTRGLDLDRPADLDGHDPPGQVILASPHVTNGPPRLRVAALMRWTEATPI